VRDDVTDQPPIYAIPLRRALQELSGDPLLDNFAMMLECQAPPLTKSATLERINTRRAEKTLARLRGDELDSWGWGQSGPRFLSWRLWRRLDVLDAELGVVGPVLPTGERLLAYP
jgi:hypothetical protein